MKKLKFIVVALIMVMAHSASYAIGFDTSVEFAISKANFKIKDSGASVENNVGYGIGLSAKLDLPLIDIGPEIWYTRNTADVDDDYTLKCNSIDVPVVLSWCLVGPLSVEAGPSFSLMSKGKFEADSQTTKLDALRPELGYVLGLRLKLLGKLLIRGRFNGSFSNQSVDLGYGVYDVRYNAWSVGAGIIF